MLSTTVSLLLLLWCASVVSAFVVGPTSTTNLGRRHGVVGVSTEGDDSAMADDSAALDEFADALDEEPSFGVSHDTHVEPSDVSEDFEEFKSKDELLRYIQSLGAITSRGEFASQRQKESGLSVVAQLEMKNPTESPTLSGEQIKGCWELVFCSTQLFRQSPFFMAGRAVCSTQDQADQYNWFCDMHRKALAISTIKSVRQIVSEDRLVSEFEVTAGAVPFLSDFTPFSYSGGLPITIDGAIVSTADITPTPDGDAWELLMDTVQIKGSNLPGVRQVLDSGLVLESRQLGSFLEQNLSGYSNPRPVFRTTYLDDQYRISRDQDDNVFVYVKTSSTEEPTDYSSVESDLGIGSLIEGFNKAITKF